MANKLTHLHIHTEHSFLDGIPTVDQLVERAVELNQGSIAITDHGDVSGHLKFQKAAESRGVKPIFGVEGYFTDNRKNRTVYDPKLEKERAARKGETSQHMTLLAMNDEGLHNLWALNSLAWIEGLYYDPRFDWELLEKYSDGLIATGGCMGGCVGQFLNPAGKTYNPDMATERLARFQHIFKDRFYMELHTYDDPEAQVWNKEIVEFSKTNSVPVLTVSDSHYLRGEDWEKHELLTAIQMGKTMTSPDRFHYGPDQLHIFSEDDLRKRLHYLGDIVEEGINNTALVNEQCGVVIKQDRSMPVFFEDADVDSRKMKKFADEGFDRKIKRGGVPEGLWQTYQDRLEYETEIITGKGFPGYFLHVRDIVAWAKSEGYLVGPGRGSAGGSLLSYVLDITDIDPIRAGLIFERFLDPGRDTLPDIDIDFPMLERHLVRKYLEGKYGNTSIATIGTLSRLSPKSLLRDLCRGLGYPQTDANAMSKLIDDTGISGAKQFNWSEIWGIYKDKLDPWMKKYPYLFELMQEFDGHIRHSGAHAAGTVVAKESLIGRLPLRQKEGDIRTQMEAADVEELGFVKIDLLGLRTLSSLMRAYDLAKKRHPDEQNWGKKSTDFFYGWQYEWSKYYEDQKVFESLHDGKLVGIFQLEASPGIRSLTKRYKPRSIEDMCAVVSVFRPGITRATDEETGLNLLEYYMQKREGTVPVKYKHPLLEQVIGDTYGNFVYQEQIMKACAVLAGYSLAETDRVRKILGKMLRDKMVIERGIFVRGCWETSQISEKIANSIFDDMESFGTYGYNKSHGYAYGLIGYWCAWMKYYYPREFMTALFETNESASVIYTRECRRLGIPILGPDINESERSFTLTEGGVIRYGLSKIKYVSGAAKTIQDLRPFVSVKDFVERMPKRQLNKRSAMSMIQVGALDSLVGDDFGLYDSATECVAAEYWDLRGDWKDMWDSCTVTYKNSDGDKITEECPVCRGSLTKFGHACKYEWFLEDRGKNEKELLDTLVTVDPFGPYINLIQSEETFTSEDDMVVGQRARVGGIIQRVNPLVTKTGRNPGSKMCQFWIEMPVRGDLADELLADNGGGDDSPISKEESVQVVSFPDSFANYETMIEAGAPVLADVEKLKEGGGLMLTRMFRLDKL